MTYDRRFVIFGLPALSLSACETIDPVVLEGILGGLGPLTQAEAAQGIRAALNMVSATPSVLLAFSTDFGAMIKFAFRFLVCSKMCNPSSSRSALVAC